MKSRLVFIGVLLALGVFVLGLVYARVNSRLAEGRLHQAVLTAETLLRQGKACEAAALLEPYRARAPKGELAERRLTTDMKALDACGKFSDARQAAELYKKTFPKGVAVADAEFIVLRPRLEAAPGDPKLRAAADALIARYPDHVGGLRLQLSLARAEIQEGNLESARQRLLTLWEAGPPATHEQAVAELLGEVNLALLLTPMPQSGEKVVTMQKGDYLFNIARDNKIPLELLLRVNRIEDPKRLAIGKTIRIPETRFSLVCDKGKNTLTLLNDGRFFKRYPVRTGRTPESTPTGEYKIINRKTNPTWRSPIDGKTYGPNDPNNELGTRWMSFEADRLGIHGTIRPETVGHYASNGCIGMLMADVEELFDLIPVGTPIRIEGKQDLRAHRVIDDPTQREIALPRGRNR